MVDKIPTSPRNVIDLARYQQQRSARAHAMRARLCRHCGAALSDGDTDDDCSSAGLNADAPVSRPLLRMFGAE